MKKFLLLLILLITHQTTFAQATAPMVLTIPNLNLQVTVNEAPLVNGVWDSSTWNSGVAHLEGTATFSDNHHAMIIVGHNPGIFTAIFELEIGDIIYLQQDTYRSSYRVTSFELIDSPKEFDRLIFTNKPELILLTCNGETIRFLVHAERILMEYSVFSYG